MRVKANDVGDWLRRQHVGNRDHHEALRDDLVVTWSRTDAAGPWGRGGPHNPLPLDPGLCAGAGEADPAAPAPEQRLVAGRWNVVWGPLRQVCSIEFPFAWRTRLDETVMVVRPAARLVLPWC